MKTLLRLCLLCLLVTFVTSQRTPAPNNALGSISSDGIEIVPLTSGRTERVSACGIRVFSFEPRSSTSQFYLEILFTAQSNVKFEVKLLSVAPGEEGAQNDADVCASDAHTCTTSKSAQTCTLTEACHPSKLWYISVRTKDLVEGFFSLDAFTYALSSGTKLPINKNENEDIYLTVSGVGKNLALDPISKFDFFYFDINPAGDVEGTVLHIEVVPTNPPGAKLPTYLNYGSELAFPDYNCHTYSEGIKIIPACEYAQGGRWHFTVVRTVQDQKYRIRLWKEEPVILSIGEEKKFYQLKRTEDEVYFKYEGLQAFDETQALRFFGIVDNIIGGSVALALQYNGLPWLECSSFGLKSCSSVEGCHVALSPCDLSNRTSGVWYLGVRALKVDSQFEPVSFTVSAVARKITTFAAYPGVSVPGTLLQGQQAHYRMNVPTDPSGNWLNLELYVDRKNSDLPATFYIGNKPFPGPIVEGCSTNTKSCTASQDTGADIKSCSIQLDPCELSAYTDGVWISVIATAPNLGPQSNYWYQDTMGFTISSLVWNPNEFPQALKPGRVITGVVADNEYFIYRLVDFTGVLKLSVSGNLHNIVNPTPAQKRQSEVAVSIVYGSRVEGPSCGKCWVQNQIKSVRATETATWIVPTCQAGSEGVFVVIKGISNAGNLFHHRENEFVLSTVIITESFAGPNTRTIGEGVLSSTISTTGVYGGTEYWILNFDRSNLLNKALTLRLRAHPLSGRKMQLSSFNGDFDYSCGANLPLDDSCTVSEANRGFCTLTYQACFFQGDRDSRTFLVVVSADTETRTIITNATLDKVYDFSFDVVEQDPKLLELDKPLPVEVLNGVYSHLVLDIPGDAVGSQTLVLEAYFDAGHQTSRGRQLTLYGNSPAHGDKLAGLPSHGCYCNSFSVSDVEKVVFIVDRCSLQGGRYHLSLYTDALQYLELSSRVTINAHLQPYVVPLAYEFPADHRLFFGQTIVFQIEITERMVNSLNRTDKELTIISNTNVARIPATIQYSLHTVLADCVCGTLGDKGVPCKLKDGNAGQCRLGRDFCQLRPPGHYYIRASVTPLNNKFDKRQAVPFTMLASKYNNHEKILPLNVVNGCGLQNRRPQMVTTFVDSTELQFFRLEGLHGVDTGARKLQIFVSNVTDGDVVINIGNDFLPTTYCNAASKLCKLSPSGPECVVQAVCAAQATHISAKATSTNNNEPVKFRISACLSDTGSVEFGNTIPTRVTLTPGASSSLQFDMTGKLNVAKTPVVVAKVSTDKFTRGDSYTVTLSRGSCGTCRAFSKTRTCTTQNCSLVVFYCDLPTDFSKANWTVQVDNGRNQTSQDTTYFISVFSVDVPDAQPINVGQGVTKTVPNLNWVRFRWSLTSNDVLSPSAGVQQSFIEIKSLDANGAAVASYTINNALAQPGDCPATLATTHAQLRPVRYTISECCTEPGDYQVLLFNYDNINSASFQVSTTLNTLATNTKLTWNFGTNSASTSLVTVEPSFNQAPGPFSEVLVQYPGSPVQPYSTLAIRVQHLNYKTSRNVAKVKAFIRNDGVAGDRSCFSFDASPIFVNGEAVFSKFACDPIRPSDIYIGLSNGNGEPEQMAVTVSTISVIPLKAGTWSDYASGFFGVNQQFVIDSTSASNWNIQLDIEMVSGEAVVFYSNKKPAGLATPGVTCTAGLAPDQTGFKITGPKTVQRILPSCTVPAGKFYIGVEPSSYGVSRFRVRYSMVNTLAGRSDIIAINWGVPLEAQSITKNIYKGSIRGGTSSNTTFVRFTMSNFTTSNTDLQYTIDYYRDGACVSSANSFCTRVGGLKKCSTIIPACEIRQNSDYYFTIKQTSGSNTVTYVVTAEIIELKPKILSYPSPRRTNTFAHSINSHDLQLYIFDIPINTILPGENIRLSLATESCGDVLVSGNRGESAGPRCSGSVPCTVAGCNIVNLDMCNLFNRGDNHRADFWVFVRGRAQTQDSPVQFSLKIERNGGYIMRTMNPLEQHTLWSVATPLPKSFNCPQGHPPALPKTCCDVGEIQNFQYSWEPERVVYVFPIEGVTLIGTNQYFRLSFDPKYTIAAKISVWNQMPSFCSQGPRLADRPGFYGSCVANSTNDRTCLVPINSGLCRLVNSHQLFVTVDYVNLTKGLPASDPTPFPLVNVRHSAPPYEIIPVHFSDQPQYFRFTLAPGERLYFKVFHAENASDWDRYHFRANMLDVKGGTISIWNHWNCGNAKLCSDKPCQDPTGLAECSKTLPDCLCSIDQIACDPGDINVRGESTFRLEASDLIPPQNLVVGRIQFDFLQRVRPLLNQTCNSVNCGDSIYYDAHTEDPNPEQLYRFQLTGVAGATQLTINSDRIAPTVFNPIDAAPCSRKRRCTVAGSLSQCTIIYRDQGVPYATVAPLQTENCADGTRKRFHLRADLYTPPIQPLKNGIEHSSNFLFNDPETGCLEPRTSEFYKYEAKGGAYLYVEITTPGPRRQVWLSANHIEYHTFGQSSPYTCTTRSGETTCSFVYACNFKSGTYYLQVSPGEHTITVTERDYIVKTLSVGQVVNLTLPTDHTQLVVFHIGPLGGQSQNPLNNLEVYFSAGVALDSWMTRHNFGDSSCSYSKINGAAFGTHVARECDVGFSDDTWNVHFLRKPTTVCVGSTITVRAKFTENAAVVVDPQPSHRLSAGETIYIKHNLGGLEDDHVIYSRLVSTNDAEVALRLFKGNHKSTSIDFAPPCPSPSCNSGTGVWNQVAWLDRCWHCGNKLYSTVFVEAKVTRVDPHSAVATFSDLFLVTSWTRLGSGVWVDQAFPGADRRMAFFTAVMTREESMRIDLDVQSGPGVEVAIYFDNCTIRKNTLPVVMWCFKGAMCQIPLNKAHNFGGFFGTSDWSSQFTDQSMRIVVTGFATTYRIRYTSSVDTCSVLNEKNAPFCAAAGFDQALMSGSDLTFRNKDARAINYYQNLTRSFACPLENGCNCGPISEKCLKYIKEYSCVLAFGPCDAKGFRTSPDYSLCRTIEHHCGKSWSTAGLPELACGHNYYVEGLGWESANGEPIYPVNEEIEGIEDSSLASGWVVLVALLLIAAVILAAAIAFVLIKRSERNQSYNLLTQDDFDGKGYAMM